MSVEGIKISLGEVSKTANTIRSLNQSLDVRLSQIQTEVVQLGNTWQSEASTTIISKMKSMSAQFAEYKKTIDNYGKFLDDTVTLYGGTETSINNNANAFK